MKNRGPMSPFSCMAETVAFSALGLMGPEAHKSRLNAMDDAKHAQMHLQMTGTIPGPVYMDLMSRWNRTFKDDAMAPGGGVLHLVKKEDKP